jgi:hypothetical protein
VAFVLNITYFSSELGRFFLILSTIFSYINFMKKFLALLALLSAVAFAQTADSAETKMSYKGPVLQFSFFNYFNAGLGYDFGKVIPGHRQGAEGYGLLAEFDSKKELHFRAYYNIAGTLLFGASAVVATDFDKTAVGLAPHFGFSFLYYRYNYYTESKFDRHELILFPTYLFGL